MDVFYTVDYIDSEGNKARGEFADHYAAWRFLHVCDEVGTPAGYPVLRKVKK